MELPEEFFNFIADNAGADAQTLRLRYAGRNPGFPLELAATQIETRRKFEAKLPQLASVHRFIIPSALALEQATCREIAEFHNSLLHSDDTVADLTAGMGADAFTFALAGHSVTACELDAGRAECLRFNKALFPTIRMSILEGDSIEKLRKERINADVIFIDPARRNAGKRLYALSDCLPDVTSCRSDLLSGCRTLLIKASPMLDISRTLLDWPEASEIYAISHKGECKEVLVRTDSGHEGAPRITAVAIDREGNERRFSILHGASFPAPRIGASEAGQWLYEPDAALMKLSPWGALWQKYPQMLKIDADTHLFVSPCRIDQLPGRWTMIERKMTLAEAKRELKGMRSNIVCRNAGIPADELRKRLRIIDGGDSFIYLMRENRSSRPTLLLTH